ncbi:trans-sialidase [Trypanosoma cruzi cruzi]|nr:trans-sialidase [Trypanosoma cruzi cruzi]
MLLFYCVRVAGASFCGHEARGGERESTASHFSCRRDAPPMTALSRASNSIVGGMTGNVVAASWMDEESLLRAALWVIACSACVVCWLQGCGCIPFSVGLDWRQWRCVSSCSCPLVDDCWRCVRLLCGGPNPLTRGLAALRCCLCVCVRAGVELPARARALAVLFPPAICFFRVCCAASCFFPLSSSPPVFLHGVAACSRAMLIVSAS